MSREPYPGEVVEVLSDPLAPAVDALIERVIQALQAEHPDGLSADELTLRFYDRFMAEAGHMPARRGGQFAAHRYYCQGRFLDRFGDLLLGRPVVTRDDRNAARQALWRLKKRHL